MSRLAAALQGVRFASSPDEVHAIALAIVSAIRELESWRDLDGPAAAWLADLLDADERRALMRCAS